MSNEHNRFNNVSFPSVLLRDEETDYTITSEELSVWPTQPDLCHQDLYSPLNIRTSGYRPSQSHSSSFHDNRTPDYAYNPNEQASNSQSFPIGGNGFSPSASDTSSPYFMQPRTPSSLPHLSRTHSDPQLSPLYSASSRLPTPSTLGDVQPFMPSPTLSDMNLVAFDPQTATANPERPRFTYREQLQKFRDTMALPGILGMGPFVPQQMYKPHTTSDQKRYVEEVMLEGPLYFISEQQYGIPLKDALRSRTKMLTDRYQVVFEGRGPSVFIRLEWPGYKRWSRQIPTKDFRSPPQPITLAKLAKDLAKCVQRFFMDRKTQPMEEDADQQWRIGDSPSHIKLEDLVLVSLHNVSLGSWQPHLRLIRPLPTRDLHNRSRADTFSFGSALSPEISIPGAPDGKVLEDFEATTCWIAAEHALRHVRENILQISEVFSRWKFQESDYAVLAGFDESLIRASIGYLEQIHIFVSAEVDATSSLLPELGQILSPFSSVLFTGSSSFHLPVFKPDGSLWEFDELVHFTASRFADGGSSATMPPTVISLSPTSNIANSPSGFSQQNPGSGEGGGTEKRSSKGGKKRARRDDDEGGNESEDNGDSPHDPPPGGGWNASQNTGPPEITFSTDSEIYLIQDDPHVFQSLIVNGSLIIEATPLDPQRQDEFPTCRAKFNDLTFGTTDGGIGVSYRQLNIKITVDSQQQKARVLSFEPKRTLAFEREEKELSSTKRSRTGGMRGGVTIGLQPQGVVAGSSMSSNEESTGFEKKRYTSRISQQTKRGVIWWSIDVDDLYEQEGGMDVTNRAILPSVKFEFLGDSGIPASPPDRMNIEIASTWSILPDSAGNEPKKNWWPPKWMKRSVSSYNPHTPSYSNLCQILALEIVPSKLPRRSNHRATLHVKPHSIDSPVVEVALKTDSSVKVIHAMRQQDQGCFPDNLPSPSTLKLPTMMKLKLSDNHTEILENSSNSTKTH